MLDGERSYIEYGVIVDRTGDGLGYYLAWTARSLERALKFVSTYEDTYPVTIQVRRVSVSGWRELD